MRKTKIVGTIGPASDSEEQIEALLKAGLNVARFNFSHSTQEEHGRVIERLRRVSSKLGLPAAILQDLQGPKIRTGLLQGGQPVTLKDGATLTITNRPLTGNAGLVSTTYEALPHDVGVGDRILLDDGLIELRVTGSNGSDVQTRVVHGGLLGEHKGINLPGVNVSAPALSEKDIADLRFGLAHGVDYVAISFVRTAHDVRLARQAMSDAGASVPLIAKLEKPEALDHLGDILRESDGVMVARGDMGVEMRLEQVPIAQKHIISEANKAGVLVITATQMLESMINNPRPTRAEASDVANAILDGTDAVMLSGEMAIGRYPVQAVQVMARIAEEVEQECGDIYKLGEGAHAHATDAEAISEAARTIAAFSDVEAVIAFTHSGLTARLIAKDRPCVDILALTPRDDVYRRMSLYWGVTPFICPWAHTIEELLGHMESIVLASGRLRRGDRVVVMGSMPLGLGNPTNFLKIHQLGGEQSKL